MVAGAWFTIYFMTIIAGIYGIVKVLRLHRLLIIWSCVSLNTLGTFGIVFSPIKKPRARRTPE